MFKIKTRLGMSLGEIAKDEVLIGKKAIISKLNENKYVLKARALK
jgi:hypothetical protein